MRRTTVPERAPRGRVLVVDDDDATRHLLVALLNAHDFRADSVASGAAALEALARESYDLALLDVNLPDANGVDVLVAGHGAAPQTEFIMITAMGTIDTAVDAMRRGAHDYLRKPLRTEELLFSIDRALADVGVNREMARLRRTAADGVRQRMVGRSPAMEQLWDRIERVAPTRATVLITGETGTGKELVARAIHELSPRAHGQFVAVNCSALPETLLESELFGHVKGSYTGAIGERRGLFETSSRGTLFLDEVATLAAGIQVKLLRVVQERVIQRIGTSAPVSIDLRLVAATNVDLATEVARGAFREDLYYRFNVFPIRVPPLRERIDDIPVLARHFLLRAAALNGITPPELPPATIAALTAHSWPGNVRQLENVIERAVILSDGGPIGFEPDTVPVTRFAAATADNGLAPRPLTPRTPSLADAERARVLDALQQVNGHHGRAAELLGVDRRTVDRKLRRYEAEAGNER
jgi:DNA-binding NtrC family response regulator